MDVRRHRLPDLLESHERMGQAFSFRDRFSLVQSQAEKYRGIQPLIARDNKALSVIHNCVLHDLVSVGSLRNIYLTKRT